MSLEEKFLNGWSFFAKMSNGCKGGHVFEVFDFAKISYLGQKNKYPYRGF
jgi:hypothetical protein